MGFFLVLMLFNFHHFLKTVFVIPKSVVLCTAACCLSLETVGLEGLPVLFCCSLHSAVSLFCSRN